MATGAKFTNFTSKSLLGVQSFKDGSHEYLSAMIRDLYRSTFGVSGVFGQVMPIEGDGPDAIKLVADGRRATDGTGRELTLPANLSSGIRFANALGTKYHVALRYAQIPDGVDINPRTGLPTYRWMMEWIGESGEPASVTQLENGSIELDVSPVCFGDQTGRTVLVWKKTPAKGAVSEAIAIERCVVRYEDGRNLITTAGALGQEPAASTEPDDYAIVLEGPSVAPGDTSPFGAGYVYIGTVIGAGAGTEPTQFDTSGQRTIDTFLTDISDVTRLSALGDRKLRVTANPADDGEAQIDVLNASHDTVFSVNERGDVLVGGDLLVSGAAVWTDVGVSGNFTAGGAGSTHEVRGTWTHAREGEDEPLAFLDGANGVVNLLGPTVTPGSLNIGGDLWMTDASGIFPAFAGVGSLGSSDKYWAAHLGATTFHGSLFSEVGSNIGTQEAPFGAVWAEHVNALQSVSTSVLSASGPASFTADIVSDFIPGVNGGQDLGSTARRWNAYIQSLNVVQIETGLIPDGDETRLIGASNRRWSGVYAKDANLSGNLAAETASISGELTTAAMKINGAVRSSLIPDNTNRWLGDSGAEWNAYLREVRVASLLRPSAAAANLGGTANRWALFATDINLTGRVHGQLIPDGTGVSANSLGSSASRWKDVWAEAANLTTLNVSASATISGTLSVGTLNLNALSLQTLNVTGANGLTANGGTFSNTLQPDTNNARMLGTSARRWSTVYAGAINASATSTFTGRVDFTSTAGISIPNGLVDGSRFRPRSSLRSFGDNESHTLTRSNVPKAWAYIASHGVIQGYKHNVKAVYKVPGRVGVYDIQLTDDALGALGQTQRTLCVQITPTNYYVRGCVGQLATSSAERPIPGFHFRILMWNYNGPSDMAFTFVVFGLSSNTVS